MGDARTEGAGGEKIEMSLSPEQLAVRKTGIGGSEVAIVLFGRDKWGCTAFDLQRRKRGLAPERVVTEAMHVGNIMEPGLIMAVGRLLGEHIEPGRTMRHEKHAIAIATPDGLTPDAVVEVKAPHFSTYGLWGDDGEDIPEDYYAQVQWEMGVSGRQVAHVGAWLGRLAYYRVQFNPEFFATGVELAERWWQRHIIEGVPCAPEGSSETTAAIRQYLPSHREGAGFLPATPRHAELAREYAERARRLKELWNEVAAIKQTLQLEIGDYEGLDFTDSLGGKLTWRKAKDAAIVDYKAVALELGATPELLAKHTTVRQGSRRFMTPKTWGAEDE